MLQPRQDAEPLAVSRERGSDVTVLVVDDHRAFREALRDLIDAAPGFALVGVACSGEEAVQAAGSLTPELVLMDVLMPGMGGIAAARAILSRCPGMMVVLISVDDPALHPGASALGRAVACVRKQDLCPRQLKKLWQATATERLQPRHGAIGPGSDSLCAQKNAAPEARA